MIKIPLLTREDLKVFEGKQVVIYGYETSPLNLYRIFKYLRINVIACYGDYMTTKNIKLAYLRGCPMVTKEKIENIIKNNKGIIVQGIDHDYQFIEMVKEKVELLGGTYSEFSGGQIRASFFHELLLDDYKNQLFYYYKKIKMYYSCVRENNNVRYDKYIRENHKNSIIICSSQKTADHTLNFTFDKIISDNSEQILSYMNLNHRSTYIKLDKLKEYKGIIKIITGVRDPIAQNLSSLFQLIGEGYMYASLLEGEMIFDVENKKEKRSLLIKKYRGIFSEEAKSDFQSMWELFIKQNVYNTANIGLERCIQQFIYKFSEHVLDITKCQFNKEKGYGIIKEGNIEIFIYQLEKLNHIVPELSSFVGVPFDTLVNANKTEDKWVGELYKQACKEIEITQEYFDRCYDEPYVKHFYSESDIEKFKERWRSHIR